MDKRQARDESRYEVRKRTLSAAAAALAHSHGNNRGDIAKVTQLLYHSDPVVREGAVKNLVKLAHRDAAPHITQALSDRDYRVRAAACYGLGYLRIHASKDKLFKALSDRQPIVRCAAAVALADMGDKFGLSHVVKLVNTKGEHQIEALKALNHITKQRFALSKLGLKQAMRWCKLQAKATGQA